MNEWQCPLSKSKDVEYLGFDHEFGMTELVCNNCNSRGTINHFQIGLRCDNYALAMSRRQERPLSAIEGIPEETLADIPDDLRRILQQELEIGGIEADDFRVRGIYLTGSRVQGRSRPSSDLDVVVEYTGSMREDNAFNMFARYRDDGRLYVLDSDAERVKLDVNPIHPERTGTFTEYIRDRPFAVLKTS